MKNFLLKRWVLMGLVMFFVSMQVNASPEENLILKYKKAHRSKDVNAAMGLLYDKGVTDEFRNIVRNQLKKSFESELADVQLKPAPEGQTKEFIRNGVIYRPNLDITKILKVKYNTTGPITSTGFPVGMKDGKYYITTAAPVGKGKDPAHTFNVSIMGTIAPKPVQFAGNCTYVTNGKSKQLNLSGEGNISKTFRGDELATCNVKNNSKEGWIQLVINENGKKVFESKKVRGMKSVSYKK